MSEEEIQLEESGDSAEEKLNTSFPSSTKTEAVAKIGKLNEKEQIPSNSGSSIPTSPPDAVKINSNAPSREFEQNYQDTIEKSEVISIPKVIEISSSPSPIKTQVIIEENGTKDFIKILDKAQSEAGSQSSASSNLPENIRVYSVSAKEFLDEDPARKSTVENFQMTPSFPIKEAEENEALTDYIKVQDQVRSESDSQISSPVNLPENKKIDSDSSKACLNEYASRKLMAENSQLASMCKSVDLSTSSSSTKEITENKGAKYHIGVQYQTKNGTGFQSSTPLNPAELPDVSKSESGTVEIVQLISLPKSVEITLPPSPNKKERILANMQPSEPLIVKDQTQFESTSQSSALENFPENFTKTEGIDKNKDTNFPTEEPTELNSWPSTPVNPQGFNKIESSGGLNEGMKLEHGAVNKQQPPSNSRPGILKSPTVKEPETETSMTKSEFAELLGKLISAIKIEEGVEITVEELSDEIFHYFGRNKEIMEIRLSGDYAAEIISKLTEPSEKKSVTFALENEEVEIEPRPRSRSNSLVDKSAEKLKKVRSFIEKIFRK